MVEDVRQEDVVQPMEGVETRLEANVIPPLAEPNIVPTESELPSSLSIVPSAIAAGRR